jgi:signal peptidase II
LILAGAFGNIIDSVFMGYIWRQSTISYYSSDQPYGTWFTEK